MPLSQTAFARLAQVSQPAVSKAVRNGLLAADDDRRLDPDHPANATYLALHASGLDHRGHAIRPAAIGANGAAAALDAREAAAAARRAEPGDGRSAGAAEAPDGPEQTAARRRDGGAAGWDAQAVTAFIDHVAGVTAAAVQGRDADLIQLLTGFEQKLEVLLAGQAQLLELLAELTGLLRRW